MHKNRKLESVIANEMNQMFWTISRRGRFIHCPKHSEEYIPEVLRITGKDVRERFLDDINFFQFKEITCDAFGCPEKLTLLDLSAKLEADLERLGELTEDRDEIPPYIFEENEKVSNELRIILKEMENKHEELSY